MNFTCPIAFFLKKQSSSSHEELKRQAKSWRRSTSMLSGICTPLRAAESIFMTEIQVISPAIPGNRMPRFTAFLFGGVAYLTFLFHDSVRHRLRIGARHAEDNQYRWEFGDIRGNLHQSRGDSAIRHPTSAGQVIRPNTGGRSLFQCLSSAAPMCHAQA